MLDTETGSVRNTITVVGASLIYFSNTDRYLVVWCKPPNTNPNAPLRNLHVYRVTGDGSDAVECLALYQRTLVLSTGIGTDTLNSFQNPVEFSDDDVVCGVLVSNEVHAYDTRLVGADGMMTIKHRIHVPRVQSFSMAGVGDDVIVATFSLSSRDQPADVSVFTVAGTRITGQQFYRVDRASLMWNHPLNTTLLILTQTDGDKTNASYYGETRMYKAIIKRPPGCPPGLSVPVSSQMILGM